MAFTFLSIGRTTPVSSNASTSLLAPPIKRACPPIGIVMVIASLVSSRSLTTSCAVLKWANTSVDILAADSDVRFDFDKRRVIEIFWPKVWFIASRASSASFDSNTLNRCNRSIFAAPLPAAACLVLHRASIRTPQSCRKGLSQSTANSHMRWVSIPFQCPSSRCAPLPCIQTERHFERGHAELSRNVSDGD